MDGQGIQLSDGRKFFVSHDDRQQYLIEGGSLELATIIECISADGASLPPGFVFKGNTLDQENRAVKPNIWYVSVLEVY